MSLFGMSPDESSHIKQASQSRNSLFDDEPIPATASGSPPFADDDTGKSSWGLNTPKKSGNVVKSLLPASDVPESYIDAYDALINRGDKVGSGISLADVQKVLGQSHISAPQQGKILEIVVPGGHEGADGIGRGEFNVMLALIGLTQEHEDVSLDGVDERRRSMALTSHRSQFADNFQDLPQPALPSLWSSKPFKVSDNPEDAKHNQNRPATPSAQQASPPNQRTGRSDSLGFPESDPWASPADHKGYKHTGNTSASRKATGSIPNRLAEGHNKKSTSKFTANGADSPPSSSRAPEPPTSDASSGGGWAPYDANSSFPNSENPGMGGDGFGDDPSGPGRSPPDRPIGNTRATGSGIEEVVTITVLPEKEGMFMFQHRNYQVTSSRRGSQVVRRYSDFVWLLDCLQKRYPFRLLPLLPPKRVAGKISHLSILYDSKLIAGS
jgi:sorting nexin-8